MKIFLIIIFSFILFSFLPNTIFAVDCKTDPQNVECVFGKIAAPSPIAGFIGTDTTGAGGISKFLSNLVTLIYSLAVVVLIFMVLWGAFDWMTSEGDKEKVASAQRKLLNAFIGILLFAVAFAVIRVVGQFTGFSFFAGQNSPYHCYNGASLNLSKNPPVCVNSLDPTGSREYPAIFCNDNQVFDANKGGCINR